MSWFNRAVVSLLLILLHNPVIPASMSDLNRLNLTIKQRQQTAELRNEAVEAGRARALLCSVCHGKDGNSVKPEVPNLAGQNTVYLLDQINKFANGGRKNYVMNSLAKSFSDDDKINLAIFYNSMLVKPVTVDNTQAGQGKTIYIKQCVTCHGEKGEGSAHFARIAGQQTVYIIGTLTQFRNNANTATDSQTAKRSSTIMEPIVRNLSDRDIKALAAYVAQL